MIYVVEFPHSGRPHSWFAFDSDDLARKVYATDSRKEWEIYSETTVRELLEQVNETPSSPTARARFPAMCILGDEHGWDTPLYRADYLFGEGVLQPRQVSELDALMAALAQRGKSCRVYWSDSEATEAIERDAYFDSKEGFWGREALREQLVSLEILEGPNG